MPSSLTCGPRIFRSVLKKWWLWGEETTHEGEFASQGIFLAELWGGLSSVLLPQVPQSLCSRGRPGGKDLKWKDSLKCKQRWFIIRKYKLTKEKRIVSVESRLVRSVPVDAWVALPSSQLESIITLTLLTPWLVCLQCVQFSLGCFTGSQFSLCVWNDLAGDTRKVPSFKCVTIVILLTETWFDSVENDFSVLDLRFI